MAEATVDRALMATAANQVEDAVHQVRATQSQLAGQVEALQGGWQGEAASAFQAAFQAFNADFTQIISALEEFHPKLLANQAKYNAQEETLSSSARRVSGLINH